MKKWPKWPWSPLLLHCLLLAACMHGFMWSSLWSADRGRENWGQAYRCTGVHDMQVPLESGQVQHYSLSLRYPWRTLIRANPLSGQKLEQCTSLFTLVGRRNGHMCDYIPIYGLWPMVWLNCQGLRRNMVGKVVTRQSGKDRPLRMGKNMKVCVSCVNAHKWITQQRMILIRD